MPSSRQLPMCWLAVLTFLTFAFARPNPGDLMKVHRAKGLGHGLGGRQLPANPASIPALPSAPLTVPVSSLPGALSAVSTPTVLPSAHPPSSVMPSPIFLLPPALPSASLPSVQPSAGVPSVGLPSAGLPSAAVPSASVPSASVPSASVPSASLPSVGVPFTAVPSAGLPSAGLSSAGLPSAGLPSAGLPSAGVPSASVPSAGVPSASLPSAGLPSAGLPSAGLPSAGLPSVGLPSLGLPPAGLPSAGLPTPTLALPTGLQTQVITSYSPIVTICLLASQAYSNVSNASYPVTAGNAPQPIGTGLSSLRPGTISCSTLYSTVTSNICSTILTGGGQLLPVTDCTQDVTFSTDHGYNLSTSAMLAPMSVIRKGDTTSDMSVSTGMPITYSTYAVPSTTYYMAAAQDVATGLPTQVKAKICSAAADGGQACTSVLEKWAVMTVPVVQSFTNTINLTTTLGGGTRMIINQVSTIDVTEMLTTISISTELPTSSTVSLPSVSTSIYTLGPATVPSTDFVTYTLESVTATTAL